MYIFCFCQHTLLAFEVKLQTILIMSHSSLYAHYINIYHDIFLSHSHLSPVLSLPSQIQPVLRAKDIEPYAPPCWWPLPRHEQQPEEEGPPTPKFKPWPRPQSASSQTQLDPRQRASPASWAQPGRSSERAGLLLPKGNQTHRHMWQQNKTCDKCFLKIQSLQCVA